jgi:hypothetical protein
MKLPSDFVATAERLPVEGYGGANRGTFNVDAYGGEFTRIESRLAVFDPLYASNRGTASFTMRGPGIDGSANADCSFKQNVVTVKAVTFDPKKFAFVCELAGDALPLPGRLTLGEPKPEGFRQRVLAFARRVGVAELGPSTIEIESVHEFSGSRIRSQTPVGYLLRQGELIIGALELTDVNPTIMLARDLTEPHRLSTLMAAVAVSLLRDPANTPLGD